MEKSYSRRTAGVTEKNATFAFSQKKHTQMQHLNESQRYTIYRMRKDKKTQSEIARYIGVSQATVSKELNGNSDTRGRYSPKMAQMFADMMKERSRHPYKFNDKMRTLIADKLEKYQWSPEQIKGYCQANDIEIVSVEWIYRFIREDKRNGGSLYTGTAVIG